MDIDDYSVFSDALELHYIDIKAFVEAVNKAGGLEKDLTQEAMLAKWLAVITEKDIKDKSIIKNVCEEQEEIGMAVSTLVELSENMVIRQAYQKRQDEIFLQRIRLEELNAALADKDAIIADKDAALADKDAIIAELRSQLTEK